MSIITKMLLSAYMLGLIFLWTGTAEKFVVPPCDRHMFDRNVDNCLSDFNKSMETSGYQERCPWPGVKSVYNKLMYCVEYWAKVYLCKGYGNLVDGVFLDVHQTYFSLCGENMDPPLNTLIMLTAPVIIAPLFMPLLCIKLTTYTYGLNGQS